MIKCNECGSNVVESKLNITLCPYCGGKITNTNLSTESYEDRKSVIDSYIENKKYDLALEELLSLEVNNKANVELYKQIINCFTLYREDSSNVLNNYAFREEYEGEAYKNALAIENISDEDKKFFEEGNKKFVEEALTLVNEKIKGIEEDINKCKLELEKIKGINDSPKSPWIERVLIVSIISLIVGLILSFAFDVKVVKYIGCGLLVIGVVCVLCASILMPSTNYTKRRNMIEKRLNEDQKNLVEVNKKKDELSK